MADIISVIIISQIIAFLLGILFDYALFRIWHYYASHEVPRDRYSSKKVKTNRWDRKKKRKQKPWEKEFKRRGYSDNHETGK